MGKAKKIKVRATAAETPRPLADQMLEDTSVRPVGRTKKRERKNEEDDSFVGDKLSKRILEQARKQQQELEEEHGISSTTNKKLSKTTSILPAAKHRPQQLDSDDEEEEEEEEMSENEYDYEPVVVNEADEAALRLFMSEEAPTRRTLADIIQEKLTEKRTEIQTMTTDPGTIQMKQLDDRVVSMYRQIGGILSKYRSGKLPKAFKVIPALSNWEQILQITGPDQWSAASMYQATRIFASNLNVKMAQRFFNLVLLPRIRDDISEYKRLNFHLYMAMKKALFKPAAFFKGILLPLCESGTCTLREAVIISSVLNKMSIPMLHSAATILKIAEMDYNGANSLFLRTLLDKKYALPYRVVDAVVFHYVKFMNDRRELPVLWHQSLLTFVQRYKEDVSSEQKELLMEITRKHRHESMTPEVQRELNLSKCRDAEDAVPPMET